MDIGIHLGMGWQAAWNKTAPIGLFLALLAGPTRAQHFEVVPVADVVIGAPLQIVVRGLPAAADVTLTAQRVVVEDGGERRRFSAQASFVSNAAGTLDLASAVPVAGTYRSADLRGLFWSMTPQPGADASSFGDDEVRLEARIDGQVVASQSLRLRAEAATLTWREASPFPGAKLAFAPTANPSARRPVIIALGGSEGGSYVLRTAALLASHGFAALGLPYYSPPGYGPDGATPPELPGLPAAFADIPVDRLEQARAWLAAQPEIDASRIAVYGVSKGAEFALLAATRMPWLKSVVAIVPSDVVWEGWGAGVEPGRRPSFAWKGEPFAFVPYLDFDKEFLGFQTGEPILIRRPQDKGRAAHPERVPAARIPVENYPGPMMVVGSHGDQLWDSGGMTENIATSRAAAGRDTLALVFSDAGHLLSNTGWTPTTQYNVGLMKVGGNPEADARAQAETFEKTLSFLKRTLSP